MNYYPLILSTIAISSNSCAETPKDPKHPNILFIAIDDLRPELGIYGANHIVSPNLDAFGKEAFIFDNAYCQQSVSGPSRASVMTGLRPDSTYITDNTLHHREMRPEVITIPQHFKDNGYHAVNYGKVFHGHMGKFNDALSWSELWYYPPQNYTKNLRGYKSKENIAYIKNNSVNGNMRNYTATATEGEDVADRDYPDGMTVETLLNNMNRFENMSNNGQPFFIALGIEKPHLPFIAPKKYWDLYDRDKITPPTITSFPEGSPQLAHMDAGELRSQIDIQKTGAINLAKSKELIHGYYACVSYVDALLGKIIDDLKKRDLYDNTIIVLWGDHGWKLGDFGQWCKLTNYEIDTRVPMMIRVPELADDGRRSNSLVELVDIFPSLCDLAGIPTVDVLQGDSFKPILENEQAITKVTAFSQFTRGTRDLNYGVFGKEYMGYAMRTATHRYVRWVKQSNQETIAEELYDLSLSNMESVNIINKADNSELINELRALYDIEIKRAYR